MIDLDGKSLAWAREVYPRQANSVLARDWEDALCLALCTLRRLTTNAEISAVCISGNGPTLVPVTFTDQALPPLHWHHERLNLPVPMMSLFLPYAAWFQLERPTDYERVRFFFSSHEWLSFRLGANPVTALPAPAYRRYYWDEEQCRILGLYIEKFPPFVNMGAMIGRVSTQAAYRFKVSGGIPIIAGGPDFITALIGVGAISEGLVCNRAGTSEGINLCAAAPIHSDKLRCLPHAAEGLWNIGGIIPESGVLFDRYREQTGRCTQDYEELLRELIPDEPCADAERVPDAVEDGRSILETIGFKTRTVLDQFKSLGFILRELRVSGGQSKSARWNQLKADITGCTLLVPEMSDGELAGNAVLAALALGESTGLGEAAARMIRIERRFAPNPHRHACYTERYQAWLAGPASGARLC